MRRLRDLYLDDERTRALASALAEDRELVVGTCLGGLPSVLVAAAATALAGKWPRLVVHSEPNGFVDDLEELGVVAAALPELDQFAESAEEGVTGIAVADRSGHNRRVAALEAYAKGALLVASPRSAEQPVPDLAEVAKASVIVKPGQEHDLHALVDSLVDAGYKVTQVVEGRGELAVRGGILDIYPWIGSDPLRIEFFGDQIESIRRFDSFTQESIAKADEAVLASASSGLVAKSLWQQLAPGAVLVVGDLALRGRLKKDHGRREVRVARQSEGVDGASSAVERLRGDLKRGLSELKLITAEGRALLYARNEEAKRELEAHCGDHGVKAEVRIGRIGAGFRDLETGLAVAHDFELAERQPVKRRGARIAGGSPLSSLTDLKRNDHVVHLRHGIGIFRGMQTLEKGGFLEDHLVLEFAEGSKLYVPVETIDLVQKYVGAGGGTPELSKIGGAAWAKKRAKAEKAVQDMAGELLLQQARRVAAGGLAFPADGPDVRKFETAFPFEETEDQLAAAREIKADMERPIAMDRLLCGDVGFGKTEVAMRAAFKAISAGYQVAVLAPTTLLAEQHLESFSERFAGTGTELAGLNRFRTGAEKIKVLERAASGDIDLLIGTHALLTDKLRFKNLGLLIVDEEHRFGVKQKERLKAVRQGGEGGHGQSADVLSLSATPIPRTLHFSLLGLRDISVLAEAPAARLAIETRVSPWDDRAIQGAIERELERGGQVFFVHSRVQDIDTIAAKIAHLAPQMKLDVVHGQMDEGDIARAMEAYKRGETQCLVTTSIIESGIDIPNANTLFVNNAHAFGLAELHQIRGRIGRFTRQAYAYFLTPANRDIGQEARERLDAIQEYAELGAGFKLAMRDLELRGAGNLLGGEQSGHIDAIGYELYTKLLMESVRRIQAGAAAATATQDAGTTTLAKPGGRPDEKSIRASTLGLAVDAYIPDSYLETPALKFELHKNLDACRRLSDVAALAHSARDRFGALVDPVARLFQLKAIKLKSTDLGIVRIDAQARQIRLHLSGALPGELAKVALPDLVHIQLDGSVLVLFVKTAFDQDGLLKFLCRLLSLDLAFLGRGF